MSLNTLASRSRRARALVTVASSLLLATTLVTNASAALVFHPVQGTWTSSDVPVHVCTSGYGSATGTKPLAHHLVLSPASALASRLEFYVDSRHLETPVLGPAGWNCDVGVGADGGAALSIYPPGVRDPIGSAHATEETMAIEAQIAPACASCIAQLACPIFRHAERQMGYASTPCPGADTPESEAVRFLVGSASSSSGVAEVTDGPGTAGSVTLSGGDYAAHGTTIYLGRHGAATLGCVLPARDASFCNVIVGRFVSSHRHTVA